MAKLLPAHEVGLPEGAGRVRVSTSRARRGKILAVEHPIFGWVPYREWALLRLVPEERILPSAIVGVSTFILVRLVEEKLDFVFDAAKIISQFRFPTEEEAISFAANLPFIGPFVRKTLEDAMVPVEGGPAWEVYPFAFYAATMAAGLTLAGLDPGRALMAFAAFLNAIIPG